MKTLLTRFNPLKASLGLALMVLISSCTKTKQPVLAETLTPPVVSLPSPPIANGQPVSVSIDLTKPGYTISDNFAGFSYETNYLARDPSFLNVNNTVLIQMIKNLGNGIIRFGGSSSDLTVWTGSSRSADTGTEFLTTTDVDQLAAFAKATGYKVIFGLNLGNFNPTLNANEAVYVANALGDNLYAFQFGNEVNNFGNKGYRSPYSYAVYDSDWVAYKNAIRSILPDAPFAGPDVSNLSQIPAFVKSFADNRFADVKLFTGHYYGGDVTFETITSPSRYNVVLGYLPQFSTIATTHNKPYRFTECGSIAGGGKGGVSDVFASSIWALDFLWQAATSNAQGVDFHGSATALYTPIARDNGVITARGTYYAMLAFKYGGGAGARIVPATLGTTTYLCTAYACTNNGKTYVTLVNRDVTDLSYTITITGMPKSMKLARLTAPSFNAKTGITFAGTSVNTDGTYTPGLQVEYNTNNGIVVNVPARTAVVVTLE